MSIQTILIDGVRKHIIPANMVGRFHVDKKIGSPGDHVEWGKKLYIINKDYSLQRLDKKKKK